MMTVYSSTTVSPEGAAFAVYVHNVDGMKMAENGYLLLMLYGRDRSRYVKILRKENDVKRTAEPLPLCHAFLANGKPISPS